MQTSQSPVTSSKPVKRRFPFSSLIMSLGSIISIVGLFFPWVSFTITACTLFIFCSSQSQALSLVQAASSANQTTNIQGADALQSLAGQAGVLIVLIIIMCIMLLIYTMMKATAASKGNKLRGGGNTWRVLSLLLVLYLLSQVGSQALSASASLNLWQFSTYFSSGVAMTFAALILILCGFVLELFSL